ncbi:hypothetical protein MNQ96_04875 [Sphingopyxis granuli]|uniref:head-tail connector protein n=1 Tax=Sphingopyxis granuli TaxID=267128 RepID=UPI001F52DEBE|nr:hypothetical protein [Sphingopyxis granuli]UNK80417.1 hypothetical protein MNQ96_04875 [Sphingopyxis granuli]
MMVESLLPGEVPVSLDEARGWLRMGATIDDAVVAGLVRAAASICEAFVGQWLIVRAGEECLALRGGTLRLAARPVVAVDAVTLLRPDGAETVLGADRYRVTIARDGSARWRSTRPATPDMRALRSAPAWPRDPMRCPKRSGRACCA